MERSILPSTWQVPAEIHDRIGNKPGRQRAMMAEGHLLLILHRPPVQGEIERAGRFFWRQPDGTWNSSEHGTGPSALSRHLDEYKELVQKYDQLETEAISATEYFAVIDDFSPALRAASAPQRSAALTGA